MNRQAFIQPRSPFRPIGDTPPLSLTRQLSPDRYEAKSLLLDCGDIRNVLFTIFCNAKDPLKFKQLHFLCSDQEGAVIARNVLFMTMLLDETFHIDGHTSWAIYFDVSIDPTCFDRICQQADHLTSLSETISDWHNSKYGKVLTFADEKTLHDVRTFWKHYNSLSKFSLRELLKFSADFMKDFLQIYEETSGHKFALGSLRALGPTLLADTDIPSKTRLSFWNTGIVGKQGFKVPAGYFANPLFVFSTVGYDQCAIHFGTDPVSGFHCASAFTDIKPDANEYSDSYSHFMTEEEKLARIVNTAKIHFKSWCSTFREVTSSESTKIAICHYTGDALRLCYALQCRFFPCPDLYEQPTAPWNPIIAFDKGAELESYVPFDVIDATGLPDTTPIPIILISMIPLLRGSSDATIFTYMFSLLGFAPAEYITGIYHNACATEVSSTLPNVRDKYGEVKTLWRYSWKRIKFGDSLALQQNDFPQPGWDANSLTNILHEIHDSMFAAEDMESLLTCLRNREEPRRGSGCTRGSFVAFMHYLKLHIEAAWNIVFSSLTRFVSAHYDEILGSGAHLLDLYFQLHQHNLLYSPDLNANVRCNLSQIPASWRPVLGDQSLQDATPFILCIPRVKLDPLAKYVSSFKGSPHEAILQVGIKYDTVVNTLSSFETTFGTLLNAENVKNREIQVDHKGWNGKGDLFIFIYLPIVELFKSKANKITVSVGFNSALAEPSTHNFGPLGYDLLVFETELSNDLYFWPYFWPVADVKQRAQPQSNIFPTYTTPRNRNGRAIGHPRIFRSDRGQLKVSFRVFLLDWDDREDLESGMCAYARPVSLCTTELKFGSWKEYFISPFSMDESTIKVKSSRRSGWIEVTSDLKLPDRVPHLNFHTFQHDGKNLSWSLPRLNIDMLPSLNLSISNDLEWIREHLKLMFSAHEEDLWTSNNRTDAMVEFKRSLFTLICLTAGWSDDKANVRVNPNRVVFVAPDAVSRVSMIIFITGIKLNGPSDSIVVDAYILPLRDEVVKNLETELERIGAEASRFICQMDESSLWKHYLRTTVEQSRSWSHSGNCTAFTESNVCRCGEGLVSDDFRAIKQWEKFIPNVIRCPLTPTFPTPYVEAILSNESITRFLGNSNLGASDISAGCCLMCGKRDIVGLKKCSRCKIAKYCSKECQREDWKRHREECNKRSI